MSFIKILVKLLSYHTDMHLQLERVQRKKKKALQYIVTDVFPSPSLNVVHKPFPKLPSTLSFT